MRCGLLAVVVLYNFSSVLCSSAAALSGWMSLCFAAEEIDAGILLRVFALFLVNSISY
jgi:hypothetical protein